MRAHPGQVSLGLGPAAHFPRRARAASPRLRVSSEPRPPKKAPAPPRPTGLRNQPGRVPPRSARQRPGRRSRTRGAGSGSGRCGDLAFPAPSRAPESHQKLRQDPTPRPRGPAPRRLGYLHLDPRGAGPGWPAQPPGTAEVARSGPCAPTSRERARAPRAYGSSSPLNLPGTRRRPCPKHQPARQGEERGVQGPLESWASSARSALWSAGAGSTCW